MLKLQGIVKNTQKLEDTMQAKLKSPQMELFKTPLKKIINHNHPLCILGEEIE
ncbi:MAG: hypothetical protein ACE5GV_03535 [Candidatus Scalindua sp.]